MFFEREKGGDQAILVHVDFPEGDDRQDPYEFDELVRSAGATPLALLRCSRKKPEAKSFIGQGKLEELQLLVQEHQADLVLFNHAISPSQARNVEAVVKCRVVDRIGLILDIFAQRARTHEGKLQVELAQLDYQATRLIRGWTHLERQKGGIGLRGPGETQLETDRRLLRHRITTIKDRLAKVSRQRQQNRRARLRSDTPKVAIVGYTNAGKSSLFNRVTQSEVYAADQLFATLDPTLRRFEVPDLGAVVLADTVGFIRQLPHKLVQAFKATLQETSDADLLLHVVDAASEERHYNMEQVNLVLDEIGAEQVPVLQIFNKIDLLDDFLPALERNEQGKPWRIWLSAKTGAGTELIAPAIAELLGQEIFDQEIVLRPEEGQFRAMLYQQQAILGERYDDLGRTLLQVRMQAKDFRKLLSKADLPAGRFMQLQSETPWLDD